MKIKISNFLKTYVFSIVLTFVDDFTLNSDNNKEIEEAVSASKEAKYPVESDLLTDVYVKY